MTPVLRNALGVQRQRDGERAALGGPRFGPDPPTVGLDQDAADVQAEAETGGLGVRPVEAIEEMGQVVGVDPGAGIVNRDYRLARSLFDADHDLAFLAAVLEGIAEQVFHHLPEAYAIPLSADGCVRRLDPDRVTHALLRGRRRAFAGELDQVERLSLQGKMSLFEPDDVGKVVDESRHAVGVRQDGFDRGFAIFTTSLQQLGASPDDRQGRAQVVADHRQEVALRGLHTLALADVLSDGGRADDPPRGISDWRHAYRDVDPPAIFGDADRIMVADPLAATQPGHDVAKLVNPLPREDTDDRLPDHLLRGVAIQTLGG